MSPAASSMTDIQISDGAERTARLAFTVILAVYGFSILKHPGFSLLDNVNLPIHETGHLVFAPFGDFMEVLGGTLFELIVPAVFVGYFVKQGDWHAASIAVWWDAENLWYISVYVRDARSQLLPLVGGGEHDWANILGRIGALQRDQVIGQRFWFAGVVLYVVAIAGGLLALTVSQTKTEDPGMELPSPRPSR